MTLTQNITAEGYDEAQSAVCVRGMLVVDLAAGVGPDALTTVYSGSKGQASATGHLAWGATARQGRPGTEVTAGPSNTAELMCTIDVQVHPSIRLVSRVAGTSRATERLNVRQAHGCAADVARKTMSISPVSDSTGPR
jgi:hypothetical protein